MKKLLLLLPLLFMLGQVTFAQDDDLPPPSSKPNQNTETPAQPGPDDSQNFQGFKAKKKVDLSKFIIEPDFNFYIYGNMIDLGVSPYVGYNVWKGLFVGGGVTYLYTGYHNIGFTDASGRVYYANANYHTFGGGVFAQYNVWHGLFVRTRFEVLHRIMDDIEYGNVTVSINPTTGSYQVNIPKIQKTIPALLIGAGYNLLQSKNFFFPIMVSYNVLNNVTDKVYSIYPTNGWVIQLGFVNIF
ncbi:MAG TPA: hypothetical protein VG603_15015 [Chitinophagales bacterium]|nr:hypothetical protein [Chitinophagales bacterium]